MRRGAHVAARRAGHEVVFAVGAEFVPELRVAGEIADMPSPTELLAELTG